MFKYIVWIMLGKHIHTRVKSAHVLAQSTHSQPYLLRMELK